MVVLGCFVLLSAGAVGSEIDDVLVETEPGSPQDRSSGPVVAFERDPLPQGTYDPYAGASLRRD